MMRDPKRSQTAIVGVGNTKFGRQLGLDATSLGIAAYRQALDDSGISRDSIDGLVLQRITDVQKFVRITGIKPKFVQTVPPQGRMTGGAIQMAADSIVAKGATTVALVYGNDGSSAGARYGGPADRYGTNSEEMLFPYGMTSPGALNALLFQRHMKEFGSTSQQLASIAVTFRKHAGLNPGAVMRTPITVADHQNSRFVCNPLRLLDYCLINDGGVAMIMTSADRAKDARHKPVYLRGYALQARFAQGEFIEDFGRSCIKSVADDVYRMADVSRADVDGLMVYDNFTPSVLFNLEGYGFCKPGEGGPWVQDGHLQLGSSLPTNTSGGQLSESYMQGWGLNAEAVRQLQGVCGERQIKDAKIIQYLSSGPVSSSIIYGSEQ